MTLATTSGQHAGLTDDALVLRIVAGERAVFALLMRRHNRRLYRLARAVLRDDAEAEDALQDAYLKAFQSMASFRGESAVSTWLARFVLNEALGRRRRSSRRQNVVPIVSSERENTVEEVADEQLESPDRAFGRSQMRTLLECKVDELPESFRTIFVMRSVEEMSVEETAACLGLPTATVRSRHFRARSLLREGLAQEIDLAERDLFEFGGQHCDELIARILDRL
jgi:RNA polymerase sigma-70 factor (ECF subfamily)